MRRRDFIKIISGSAAAWPLAASAQRSAMPVIGLIREGSAQGNARWVGGFQKGLSESGYVEGKNVTVDQLLTRFAAFTEPRPVAKS